MKINLKQWAKDVRGVPETGDDLEDADRRVKERRYKERRRHDRLGRWVERAALLLMVVIMVVGWAKYDSQQEQIDAQQAAQKANRKATSKVYCDTLNELEATLRGIIINGAVASKPFDRVYRQFGLPPYEERLQQAKDTAAKLAPLKCGLLQEAVEKNLATLPRSVVGGP